MTKTIAKFALLVLGLLVSLGNYWFTFGLWPKNWWSFFGFALCSVALMLMNISIDRESRD
ncbi:MAG: hypothetical protein AB7J46_06240 [Candidatus Altimarinota bacterium]